VKHKEHETQCAIIRLLRLNKILCFAIPNGEKRERKSYTKNGKTFLYSPAGARLKKEGVLAGVADIEIWANNKVYYVEVKTEKGRQTQAQKDFQSDAIAHGHEYKIWRSLDSAISFVNYITYIRAKELRHEKTIIEIEGVNE